MMTSREEGTQSLRYVEGAVCQLSKRVYPMIQTLPHFVSAPLTNQTATQ
jgi:hypothetical protein